MIMNTEEFEQTVAKMWEEVTFGGDDTSEYFDAFCEKLDKVFQDDDHNVYVRLVWWCDSPDEIYDELLDLGKRFYITEYTSFRDDINECTVIVAQHEKYQPK